MSPTNFTARPIGDQSRNAISREKLCRNSETDVLFRREPHVYPSGVEIFRQGDEAANIYLVKDGLLKLVRLEDNGSELVVDLIFSGFIVGAAATISRRLHPFTAITLRSSVLVRMDAPEFLEYLRCDSALLMNVSEILSREVYDHIVRISELTSLAARQRLEKFLLRFWKRSEQNDCCHDCEGLPKLRLPLKQYELASLLSITPTYLCRLLNALEREEVIARSKGCIMIRKPSELWHDAA